MEKLDKFLSVRVSAAEKAMVRSVARHKEKDLTKEARSVIVDASQNYVMELAQEGVYLMPDCATCHHPYHVHMKQGGWCRECAKLAGDALAHSYVLPDDTK